jgi:transcription initiation factor TFIIIB Brf1 subunit/transcription initiation factor TFIIB
LQDLQDILDQKRKKITKKYNDDLDMKTCKYCHIKMERFYDAYSLICSECSYSEQYTNNGEVTNNSAELNNTSNNSYMSLKPVGSNGRSYFATMISCIAESDPQKYSKILTKLKKKNYRCDRFTLPNNILTYAAKSCMKIKQYDPKYIIRGMNLDGFLGACCLNACREFGIAATKSGIAYMMEVTENKISGGMKDYKKYSKLGVVKLATLENHTEDFILAYFDDFSIDYKYLPFIKNLLNRIEKKHIYEIEKTQTKTKCIGIITMLSKLIPFELKYDEIMSVPDDTAKVAYGSIESTIIKHENELKKIFIRHNIPLPKKWLKKKVKKKMVKKESKKIE